MDRSEQAVQYFMEGYNCAQSVAMAFADRMGMDVSTVSRLASPFGAGVGRLREVCGAVSGMMMVLGILYGNDVADDELKKAVYERTQALAGAFREQVGTIICREILDNPSTDPTPSERNAAYYAQRPCARMVFIAAHILENYIATHEAV